MKKDKAFQTKVVIRRLPSTMTEEQFIEQLSPLPEYDYLNFVKADMRLGQHAFSRAYINFLVPEDIFIFKDRFDGYVFLDNKGCEYSAIVEFAPFQKIPKKRSKKKDAKCGTILIDPDYLKFLENLENPNEVSLPSAESYLEEIESREKEMKANNGCLKTTTPLIEFLKARKLEQQKIREEKREERKRKEMEKKRIREEERRRRRAEKDKEKVKEKSKERSDSLSEKETTDDPEEPPLSESPQQAELVMQVLKNPEREKEQKEVVTPQKTKDYYVSSKDKPKREWERIKPKDKQKISPKSYYNEKERGRREKSDYKIYNSKKQQQDSEKCKEAGKDAESSDSKSIVSPENKKDSKRETPTSRKDESEMGASTKCNEITFVPSKNAKKVHLHDDSLEDSYKKDSAADHGKDQRSERRIRNKDRPSLEIYRPGMKRFTVSRSSPQKDISSNSSSPSPTPPSKASL